MTTYIGRGLKRFEDPRLVKGGGSYVEDLRLPDSLHAAFLRSPHAHASIRSIDTTAARSLPGVVAVVTAQDLADTIGYVPASSPNASADMASIAHPLLAGAKVRYVGEPVAMVVAENHYLAKDALDHIIVEFEVLPPIIEPNEALKDEVILHEELGTNLVVRINRGQGDLDDAFRRADKVVRGYYESQRVSPVPLENRGVAATYDRDADLLTVWSSTQDPHGEQASLAQVLKRDLSTIRVIAPDVGGGFGQKGSLFPDVAAVCYLATKLGRPVKWIEERRENMLAYHCPGVTCQVEAAVRMDGTILGLRFQVVCDVGAYFIYDTLTPSSVIARYVNGPYTIPVIHTQVLGVVTNKSVTGSYRGASVPEATYFLERTIDLIAAELGLDTADIRKKNFLSADAFPYSTPTGMVYDTGDYAMGFQQCLELAGYANLRREQALGREKGRILGVGIASFIDGSGGGGSLMESVSRIQLRAGGRLDIYTEASPHGQGSDTTFAQIAADTLGIQPDDVTVLHGDTEMLTFGRGTMSSRGLIVSGSAVYQALYEARRKLSEIAAQLLECSPEEVEFRDGRVASSKAPQQSVPLGEIVVRAQQGDRPLEFSGSFTLPGQGVTFGAHIVLVEIDGDTGETKLLRYAGVHDCGRIINPRIVEGQMHGGIAQGIGKTMTEAMVYTPEGQPATGTLMDYAIPYAEDVPELLLDTQEIPSTTNPLGTKGVGELPTVGVPAAVGNGIADALSHLGARHLDPPYTPEKVWRILRDARS